SRADVKTERSKGISAVGECIFPGPRFATARGRSVSPGPFGIMPTEGVQRGRPMKIKRIAIYGGTELNPPTSGFVGLLATALLERTDARLVTGGYDYREGAQSARSTDRSVAEA